MLLLVSLENHTATLRPGASSRHFLRPFGSKRANSSDDDLVVLDCKSTKSFGNKERIDEKKNIEHHSLSFRDAKRLS